MRPVCTKCKVEMEPKSNEVAVWHPCEPVDMYKGEIDFVIMGDRWECPVCHGSFITGYGGIQVSGERTQEWLRHFRDAMKEQIRILRGKGQ